MTMNAVALAGVCREHANASKGVGAGTDGLKVRWIDTTMIAADMVDDQTFSNRANQELVRQPVSHIVPASPIDDAIAKSAAITGPFPTPFGLLHQRPKPPLKGRPGQICGPTCPVTELGCFAL